MIDRRCSLTRTRGRPAAPSSPLNASEWDSARVEQTLHELVKFGATSGIRRLSGDWVCKTILRKTYLYIKHQDIAQQYGISVNAIHRFFLRNDR
jgi:hypothetical protein